ncbi:MAG: hypothetical protein Q8P67_13855 [archaeon]|nr:hypothetical protein [archaeon]
MDPGHPVRPYSGDPQHIEQQQSPPTITGSSSTDLSSSPKHSSSPPLSPPSPVGSVLNMSIESGPRLGYCAWYAFDLKQMREWDEECLRECRAGEGATSVQTQADSAAHMAGLLCQRGAVFAQLSQTGPLDEGARGRLVEAAGAYVTQLRALAQTPLRHLALFGWTDLLTPTTRSTAAYDALFEAASVLLNTALWLAHFADRLAAHCRLHSPPSPAAPSPAYSACFRLAYTSLLEGALLLQRLDAELLPSLAPLAVSLPLEYSPGLAAALSLQLTAQAQECTLVRAAALGHSSSLRCRLALAAHSRFQEAAAAVVPLSRGARSARLCKMSFFLQAKEALYLSVAWAAHAAAFFDASVGNLARPGHALACYREAAAAAEAALVFGRKFSAARPVGSSPLLDELQAHCASLTTEHQKLQSDNDRIYYATPPTAPPPLPLPEHTIKLPSESLGFNHSSSTSISSPSYLVEWNPSFLDAWNLSKRDSTNLVRRYTATTDNADTAEQEESTEEPKKELEEDQADPASLGEEEEKKCLIL